MGDILEKIAEIEHDQWIQWAKDILHNEPSITTKRRMRWLSLMVPYKQLTEEQKEQDRIWAQRTIETINEFRGN